MTAASRRATWVATAIVLRNCLAQKEESMSKSNRAPARLQQRVPSPARPRLRLRRAVLAALVGGMVTGGLASQARAQNLPVEAESFTTASGTNGGFIRVPDLFT